MRASLATRPADQVSGHVLSVAGVLCGVLVFFVAIPLALSSPYPTLKESAWVAPRSTFELASVTSVPRSGYETGPAAAVPAVIELPLPLQAQASARPAEPVVAPVKLASIAPAAGEAGYLGAPRAAAAEPAVTGSIPRGANTKTASLGNIDSIEKPVSPLRRSVPATEEVDQYLWEVYQRAPVKRDSSGDFSWKDPAAAKRLKMSLTEYTIGGMDPDFREQLYHAGRAMDAVGIQWSMNSAFRDDYRQALASGFKARPGNSLHGGSRRTGGYGHGQAADLTSAEGNSSTVWRWIDAHGAKYGLVRPMPGADPAHVQPRGSWHQIAMGLREQRTGEATTQTASAGDTLATRTASRRGRHQGRRYRRG